MTAIAFAAVAALQMVGLSKNHEAIFKIIVFIGLWLCLVLLFCHTIKSEPDIFMR